MTKVAVIQKTDAKDLLNRDLECRYDLYGLCSDYSKKKVLKRDVDINIDIDQYDWIILVGSEALQHYTKYKSVTDYCGTLVDGKFIPILNPAMISFKPEAKKPYQSAMEFINNLITGRVEANSSTIYDLVYGLETAEEIKKYLCAAIAAPLPYFGLDSETAALYPRDGHMLGISLAYCTDHAAYMNLDEFDEECIELLQQLVREKTTVFHNAKFDMKFMQYHLGIRFYRVEDTMLLHYLLDERTGTHGLKQLAVKFTPYGDYEAELTEFINEYIKIHGIRKADFSYELIPFDVMYPYAAMDSLVTLILYEKFKPLVESNQRLRRAYNTLIIPGMKALVWVEENGVPFDHTRLEVCDSALSDKIVEAREKLREFPEVVKFESVKGDAFNPNSTKQLRELLFDYVGLTPTGIKTPKGEHSTNAEVLEILAENNPIPAVILELRKFSKIKNTYIDKILPELDRDGRLRTGFNLHMTSSGRLSSSGKLNLQQLPRDVPIVKGAIKARPGYKIIAMDLGTAEVYVAAVLSGDKMLQEAFRQKEDFHSTIAKMVFNLPCEISEVKELYPIERQQAKAVTFGIMYGAGAAKISAQVTKDSGRYFSKSEADEVIGIYFRKFHRLKAWLEEMQDLIYTQGYVYSVFGRKRRLLNVRSSDSFTRSHEIRSGVNFLVQSVASDINLLALIEMYDIISKTGKDAQVLALVHDSIIAEVKEEECDWYVDNLTKVLEKDQGVSIPDAPIALDFDIGDDYSFGKYEEYVKENF